MKDLTIIYITANQVPDYFAQYQQNLLIEAAGDYPIISISRKPLNFGDNIIDDGPICYENIYKILLMGAKKATTEFIAIAEDDSLYNKEHFNFFRPPKDTVAYNMCKWSLFTWKPIYNLKLRKNNATLIAPREYFIEALEERFNKYPDGLPHGLCCEVGRNHMEQAYKVTERNSVEVYSETPVIQLSHPNATDDRQRRMRKKLGSLQAYDIPYWGKAEDIIKNYK